MKYRPFIVPNYVVIQDDRPKRNGIQVLGLSYRLSEVGEKELSELCDEFRKTVFDRAGKKDPRG